MTDKIKIIGIGGTNGAGKDTIGELLASQYNYLFISVTELLRAELRTKNLPVDRGNLSNLSASWRREFGLGVLVDKSLAEFEKVKASYVGLAIASLRNPGEVDRVHELGGQVIWVDADPKIRYQRVQNANRGRAGEDDKTYEEFLAEEAAEMEYSGDKATLSGAAVKAKADIFMTNDGDLSKLKGQLDQLVAS